MGMPERVEPDLAELEPSFAESARRVWPELLQAAGPAHDDAVRRLHTLMIKAARHQVSFMYPTMPVIGGVRHHLDEALRLT